MREFLSENLILRTLKREEAPILREYLLENREFLREWSPTTKDDFYELANIEKLIISDNEQNSNKSALKLHIFLKRENKLIGTISLSNIVYGPFLSCFLGYKLHKDFVKKGYMREALETIIDFAFNELKLHRIEANIMPKNLASQNLVKKFGFINEGLSRKYLKINGVWEDHLHFVLLNEKLEGEENEG